MYAKDIGVLSKGNLQIFLLPSMKLQEMGNEVKKAIQITNPDYNIVIKELHLYYGLKLVTFCINEKRNLIVQFPIFIHPYPASLMFY